MKKITLLVVSFLLVASVALADVFIVGGYNSKQADLEDIQAAFPGSKIVISEHSVPIWWAADKLLEQLKAEGFDQDKENYFIAHSWGGQLLKQLFNDNPEIRINKLVLIATPNKSFWFLPPGLFSVKAGREDVSYFAIAGSKSSDTWYLRSDEPNDGVVEVSAAVAVENVVATAIFPLDHAELLHAQEVIFQVKAWLELPDSKNLELAALVY